MSRWVPTLRPRAVRGCSTQGRGSYCSPRRPVGQHVLVFGIVIDDETLCLRPVSLEDSDEWMAGEDDEQIRWFEFLQPARRDDVVRAIERWQDSWRSGGPFRHWGVCERRSQRLAGGVEVRDLGDGEVDLSYVVFAGFRRAGIATRACRLALRYAANEMVRPSP